MVIKVDANIVENEEGMIDQFQEHVQIMYITATICSLYVH